MANKDNKSELELFLADEPYVSGLEEECYTATEVVKPFVKRGRKVKGCNRYSTDGTLEKSYHDYYEVEQDGYSRKEVQRCCLHHRKTYKGKVWEYHNDFIAG